MLAITPHAWTPPHAGTCTQPHIYAQHTLFHPDMLYVLFVFIKSHMELKKKFTYGETLPQHRKMNLCLTLHVCFVFVC